MNGSNRIADIKELYRLLDVLMRTQQRRLLSKCSRSNVPLRGVYFFYECGECRSDSGNGYRIVRVGTHALRTGSKTTLWSRLSHHKGNKSGGGNHRASIFRLLAGTALLNSKPQICPSWGRKTKNRPCELPTEQLVTKTLGNMWVLCLPIKDKALRGFIESNAIALLSNYNKIAVDCPSWGWLGYHCARPKVRKSGLWNQHHVNHKHKPGFLNTLEKLIINPKGTT